MHRWPGAIVAGGLFVLPGIISIMALSYIYAAFGAVPAVAAFFFGLKAAVLAIVVFGVVVGTLIEVVARRLAQVSTTSKIVTTVGLHLNVEYTDCTYDTLVVHDISWYHTCDHS